MAPRQVTQSIVILGRDGHRAVLAMLKIVPEFEGKQVIPTERMRGQPLDGEHLSIIVPLEKRCRSLRDVMRVEITAPPSVSQ